MTNQKKPADIFEKYGSRSNLTLDQIIGLESFFHGLKKDGWGFFLYWLVIIGAIVGGFLIGLFFDEDKAKTAGFAAAAGALGAVFQQKLDKREEKTKP
jgi:uncharacterized membrane protein YeaQ/YmgE (transglycosylase-associated protein family)